MKLLLILLIKFYWTIVPAQKRRKCIFRISCSKYVYDKTTTEGLISGIKALKYRFQNCKADAQVVQNPFTGTLQVILPNQQVIEEQEVSKYLLNKNINYGTIHDYAKSK